LDQAYHAMVLPTGAGQAKKLSPPNVDWEIETGWLPDSKHLLVATGAPGRHRTAALDVETGELRALTPEGFYCMMPSPDGTRAVCELVSGPRQILAFDSGQTSPLPNLRATDDFVSWGADGRSLLVRPHDQFPMRVYRLDLASGGRELVREIAVADRAGLLYNGLTLKMTSDGESYCYSAHNVLGDLYVVDGLR
jgi:hypothetical protein